LVWSPHTPPPTPDSNVLTLLLHFHVFRCALVILLIHPWLPWWRVSTPQHLCVSLVCLVCMCVLAGVVLFPVPYTLLHPASFHVALSEYCT
jgi:hypothetical protein